MTLSTIVASTVPPQAWRNGGGQTRQLLTWPAGTPGAGSEDWQLRISLADITQDGPFSAYIGVQRCFAVVRGAGVRLQCGEQTFELRTGDAPLKFDGGLAPDCTLLNGPTQDLNLMSRSGSPHMTLVCPHTPATAATAASANFGLFTRVAGHLRVTGQTDQHLPAHCLLWDDDVALGSQWQFVADAPTTEPLGWWLSYAPHVGVTL